MNTGPQNVITGDTFGTDLPLTEVDNTLLAQEKNMARFSRTKEFQELKAAIEQRIDFYQSYLPDGRALTTANLAKDSSDWIIANTVIAEFKRILSAYENAAEVIRNAAKRAQS